MSRVRALAKEESLLSNVEPCEDAASDSVEYELAVDGGRSEGAGVGVRSLSWCSGEGEWPVERGLDGNDDAASSSSEDEEAGERRSPELW